MFKLRRLGVASGAALLSAALIAPMGSALAADPMTTMVKDSYGAAASGEVLDLHLLGRHVSFGAASVTSTLDSLAPKLDAEAKGIATMLVPASTAVARFGDSVPAEACAVPEIQKLTGLLAGDGLQLPVVGDLGLGGLSLGGLLPKLEINVGCATASVAGSPADFVAESVGGILHVSVALPEAIQSLVGTVRGLVPDTLGTAGSVPVVGDLLNMTEGSPLAPVSGLIGQLGLPLGLGGAAGGVTDILSLNALAPVLNPTQTVDSLLAGIENGDLLRIDLGVATAQNSGSVEKYLSQAVANGGVVEVMPNFGGADKPLLRISIAKSTATVQVDRAGAVPTGSADNTIVRIESPLLPDLNLASLPIVGGLLGSTGLPVVDSVVPVIEGLLGGVPVADNVLGGLLGFDATVKGLGLKSGPGYIELSPGMSVSILCEGLVSPLCSEISVGAVKAPEMMPDGRMRVESSAATIHLFKNLDTLGLTGLPVLGDLKLGSILGNDLLGGLLAPITGAAGLNIGEASTVPGIKLSLAHAVAEAGGTKVMGAIQEQARDLAPVASAPAEIPALPRTGGLPVDATAIPVLLGASAGLRALVRRRRNA